MKRFLLLSLSMLLTALVSAQQATVRMNASTKYQHITGFGGFVCSPQFTYNHMTTAEIKKVWGKESIVGCNIMRLYIPIGKNTWSQSLATAKLAKQMGLIVFASPWGQPAEWKTNGSSNAKNSDGTVGYLKKENWADYVQYLEDYVQYLRKNGVELDAISIQNEPDWQASYAGCIWSTDDMAKFVKTYGRQISCKIMAPESIGCSDGYVNALNKSDIIDCFDIYGGHQYGGIQSGYKNLAKKGKEIWMTEYLINWNEAENNTRNFDFSKDFFNFFRAINTCMLGDFNAWIHYAAKRYYAMMGDGQRGAGSSGTITKRGYVMAHFARFITGMTRVATTFSGGLEGSGYLSVTGDTAVIVMANASDNAIQTTVDLPFYMKACSQYITTKAKSFINTSEMFGEESCRPVVEIPAQSVVTVLYFKYRERQASDMKGTSTRFDRLDDMATTKTTFGTTYKISGKTKTFDSSNPLISSRKTAVNGYIALDDAYTALVFHVNKVTSTNALTAGKPTLYYINSQGVVSTHEYDRIDLGQGAGFDIVLDLSTATLKDGCIGLLSFTCDNAQSHLTITFGDVYLSKGQGGAYHATLSGAYVADDSNVLEYSADPTCTSIDMTGVTGMPASLPWLDESNRVVYVGANSDLVGSNVVKDGICTSLVLDESWGLFRPAMPFIATAATYTCQVNGQHIVQLPFEASVPDGVGVFILSEALEPVAVTTVPANQPLLVVAEGTVTFVGSGDVTYKPCSLTDAILPIDVSTAVAPLLTSKPRARYLFNIGGQRVSSTHRGIIVSDGKKYIK